MFEASTATAVSTPTRVGEATRRKSRNRKRTRGATISRRLHAKARNRQKAWLITGRPLETARLTRELANGFEALREVREGEPAPGTYLEGGRFYRKRPELVA